MGSPPGLSADAVALRKRPTYGTLLPDLAPRRPLAGLPDRDAEAVAQWLQAHPGVEVLVRDRAGADAAAARLGAPAACRVADRLHLRQHRADTLTDVCRAHAPPWARATAPHLTAPPPVHAPAALATDSRPPTGPLAPPPPSTRALARAAARRAQRVATDEQVWSVQQRGWALDASLQPVGLRRRTGRRDLQRPTSPARPPRDSRDRRILAPDQATLLAGWNRGWRHGWPRLRALRSQGFQGQSGMAALSVRRRRQAQGFAPGQRRSAQLRPAVTEGARRWRTPRRATG
jgi:transposase